MLQEGAGQQLHRIRSQARFRPGVEMKRKKRKNKKEKKSVSTGPTTERVPTASPDSINKSFDFKSCFM